MPDVDPALTDYLAALAEAARRHLRRKFLTARVAISGTNFGIAETGTLAVVESEGNGRMCLTLPQTLITVMGIEKIVPTWRDMEVFLQLLPRSSTAERMNPYTSTWTGSVDGQDFHLVLLDNGRTATLADPRGRSASRCIRCSACLNVCPVYQRTGGHAYGSVYPGPIGAALTPQLTGVAYIQPDAAVRLNPVRRVLRRVPGRDRHSRHAGAPALARGGGQGGRTPDTDGRGRGHDRPGLDHDGQAPLDVGVAGRAAWPHARPGPDHQAPAAAVGMDGFPGCPPSARTEFPGLVGQAMSRSACSEILGRIRAARSRERGAAPPSCASTTDLA